MCLSESRLWFGILVPVLDLVVAANAWPRRKVLGIIFESFILARHQGRLVISEGIAPGLLRVPPEIWHLIESHAALALFEDEKHRFIKSMHACGAGSADCSCAVCTRDENLTLLGHDSPVLDWPCVLSCDLCYEGFLEVSGIQEMLEDQKEDINHLLDAFDLALVHDRPISYRDNPVIDLDATAAIGLLVSSTVCAEASHGSGGWVNAVQRLDPSFFIVPPDAQDRFRRLLRTCRLGHEVPSGVGTREGRVGLHEGVGTACGEEGEVEPAGWHLWGSVSDCT